MAVAVNNTPLRNIRNLFCIDSHAILKVVHIITMQSLFQGKKIFLIESLNCNIMYTNTRKKNESHKYILKYVYIG